jgi:hypothetical protein
MLKRIVVLMFFFVPFVYLHAQVWTLPSEQVCIAYVQTPGNYSSTVTHTVTNDDIQVTYCGLTTFNVSAQLDAIQVGGCWSWQLVITQNGNTVYNQIASPTSFSSCSIIKSLHVNVGDVITLSIGIYYNYKGNDVNGVYRGYIYM